MSTATSQKSPNTDSPKPQEDPGEVWTPDKRSGGQDKSTPIMISPSATIGKVGEFGIVHPDDGMIPFKGSSPDSGTPGHEMIPDKGSSSDPGFDGPPMGVAIKQPSLDGTEEESTKERFVKYFGGSKSTGLTSEDPKSPHFQGLSTLSPITSVHGLNSTATSNPNLKAAEFGGVLDNSSPPPKSLM